MSDLSSGTSNIGLIIDLVILAITVISVIIGAKKGLLKSILSIVIVIVALLAAYLLSGPLSQPVTDWVYPKVQTKIEGTLQKASGIDVAHLGDKIDNILSHLGEKELKAISEIKVDDENSLQKIFSNGIPEEVREYADSMGIDIDSFLEKYGDSLDSSMGDIQKLVDKYLNKKSDNPEPPKEDEKSDDELAANVLTAAGKAIIKPIVRFILGILLFVVLLLILKLIVAGLSKLTDKTPVIGTINSVGGALVSLIKVALVVYLLVFVCVRLNLGQYIGKYTDGSIVYSLVSKLVPAIH